MLFALIFYPILYAAMNRAVLTAQDLDWEQGFLATLEGATPV